MVAAGIIAVAAYAGWAHFHGQANYFRQQRDADDHGASHSSATHKAERRQTLSHGHRITEGTSPASQPIAPTAKGQISDENDSAVDGNASGSKKSVRPVLRLQQN